MIGHIGSTRDIGKGTQHMDNGERREGRDLDKPAQVRLSECAQRCAEPHVRGREASTKHLAPERRDDGVDARHLATHELIGEPHEARAGCVAETRELLEANADESFAQVREPVAGALQKTMQQRVFVKPREGGRVRRHSCARSGGHSGRS